MQNVLAVLILLNLYLCAGAAKAAVRQGRNGERPQLPSSESFSKDSRVRAMHGMQGVGCERSGRSRDLVVGWAGHYSRDAACVGRGVVGVR